jgi:hypothetical protein
LITYGKDLERHGGSMVILYRKGIRVISVIVSRYIGSAISFHNLLILFSKRNHAPDHGVIYFG